MEKSIQCLQDVIVGNIHMLTTAFNFIFKVHKNNKITIIIIMIRHFTITIQFHRKLQIHIALEDQTKENGTLYYIPGSHR